MLDVFRQRDEALELAESRLKMIHDLTQRIEIGLSLGRMFRAWGGLV
jgi:hypothetical protein